MEQSEEEEETKGPSPGVETKQGDGMSRKTGRQYLIEDKISAHQTGQSSDNGHTHQVVCTHTHN